MKIKTINEIIESVRAAKFELTSGSDCLGASGSCQEWCWGIYLSNHYSNEDACHYAIIKYQLQILGVDFIFLPIDRAFDTLDKYIACAREEFIKVIEDLEIEIEIKIK